MADMPPPPVRLTLLRHPFSTSREVVETPFTPKVSLQALAESHGMAEGHVIALVGDVAVPRAMWPHIAPKPGVEIILRRVPEGGGGGKNPLSAILSIASFFVPLAWGPAFMGLQGIGWYGVLAKGALTLLGMALSRPQSQRLGSASAIAREPTTFQVTGGSNKVTPYGVVPRVYGRHRVYPPFAAQPYTETVGGKQYLNLLFDFGYGPLLFEDFRIGATPLANFTAVEMEVRPGYSTDSAITLYRNDVSPQALSILVKNAAGPRIIETALNTDEATLGFVFAQGLVTYDAEEGTKLPRTVRIMLDYRVAGSGGAWSTVGVQGGAAVASTAATLIDSTTTSKTYRTDIQTTGKIDLKLNFTAGDSWRVFTRSEGATTWVQHAIVDDSYVEIMAGKVPGSGAVSVSLLVTPGVRSEIKVEQSPFIWTPENQLPPAPKAPTILEIAYFYVDNGYYDFTASQANPYLIDARIRFPARAKYEVRLTRVTADAAVDNIRDEITWGALNSITYTPPVAVTGHALVALRIQASEQLNGMVQEFSAIATALLKTWDGAAWTDYIETRNPAWVYADILCGTANARPIDRARLDTAALATLATNCNARGTQFNGVFDFRATVFESARDVLAVGRASFHMRDGLYSCAEDKAQSTPVQHFTPRNTWGYSGSRRYVDLPHALKVRFLNRDKDWQQDERIVPDDGYTETTATRFEVLELFGVDNAAQAWRDGRFHIANARLRTEEHAFYADVEHIVCNRGDLIRFSHDVVLQGLGFGRLKTVTLNGSSEATAATLDAEIVMETGKSYSLRIRRSNGSSVVAPIVTAAGGFTSVTFSTPVPAADAPAAGDLFLFGLSGSESVELLVTAIEPRADLSALIHAVDAAPAVYASDTQAIPRWSSQISLPAVWERKPAVPVFESVDSDEDVIVLTSDGGYLPVIQVTVVIPSGGALPTELVEIGWRLQGDTSWNTQSAPAVSPTVVTISGVQQGLTYELRARSLFQGATSAYTETTHTVIGAATPPPAVTNLLLRNGALIWSHAQPRDHAGYRVRFNAGSTRTWDTAADAHLGLVTAAPFDISGLTAGGGTMTFLVKAVDFAGIESDSAAALTVALGDAITDNVILTENQHPAFTGTITNGAVDAGALKANDTSTFWGPAAAPFWGNPASVFWDTVYAEMAYEFSITPTAAQSGPGRVLLAHDITGSGYAIDFKIAGSEEPFWGDGAAPFWGAASDPFWDAPPDWSAWPGELTPIRAIWIDFRITCAGGVERGVINTLAALLDVPDVIEVLEDAAISSAGTTRLPITQSFRAITAVQLTLQDTGTGARSVIAFDKDEVNGPLVKAYDGSGSLVNASVDATVQGY